MKKLECKVLHEVLPKQSALSSSNLTYKMEFGSVTEDRSWYQIVVVIALPFIIVKKCVFVEWHFFLTLVVSS